MKRSAIQIGFLLWGVNLTLFLIFSRAHADPITAQAERNNTVIRLSRSRYDISTLALRPGAAIIGEGWSNNSNVGHGGHEWSTLEGSVIHCAGSGVCVSYIPQAHRPSPVHLENLAIIGDGQGTGLQLGDASHTPVFGTLSNVLIANFSTGLSFAGEDFNFNGLFLQANEVGLSITTTTANENCWYGLRLQHNGIGLSITSGYELNFFGGLVQSDRVGMLIGTCSNCEFEGFDFEANTNAGIINRGDSNLFINNRFAGGQGDNFRIESGEHCVLLGNRVMGANQMFIGKLAHDTVLLGNTFNGIVDKSKDTISVGNVVLKVR